MAEGYQTILTDLEFLAASFRRESELFSELSPKMAPGPVDAGGELVNVAIKSVMSLLTSLNKAIAGQMYENYGNVLAVHDGYKENDADVEALFNKMMGSE